MMFSLVQFELQLKTLDWDSQNANSKDSKAILRTNALQDVTKYVSLCIS